MPTAVERMARLVVEIEAEAPLLARLATEAEAARPRLLAGDPMACSHAALLLHRWYTGLEGLLERVERAVGIPPSPGPGWHRDLLRGVTLALPERRPAVLRAETEVPLLELLAFRHFVRHAYAAELDPSKLARGLDALLAAQPASREDLEAFVAHLRATIHASAD